MSQLTKFNLTTVAKSLGDDPVTVRRAKLMAAVDEQGRVLAAVKSGTEYQVTAKRAAKNENGERELVTFAKAYSGLTDAEFRKVDDFIKKNTIDKFGPVRSVTPVLVFEIGFEGISISKRHKSGIATRFPRILRWRLDKKIEDANTIEDLKSMIM